MRHDRSLCGFVYTLNWDHWEMMMKYTDFLYGVGSYATFHRRNILSRDKAWLSFFFVCFFPFFLVVDEKRTWNPCLRCAHLNDVLLQCVFSFNSSVAHFKDFVAIKVILSDA